MKKNVLKLALMGLAIGSTVGGCVSGSTMGDNNQNDQNDQNQPNNNTGKSTCKGVNGCTGKADCIGSSGCKGKNGCTGKSDCIGGTGKMPSNQTQNTSSTGMKEKREAAAKNLTP